MQMREPISPLGEDMDEQRERYRWLERVVGQRVLVEMLGDEACVVLDGARIRAMFEEVAAVCYASGVERARLPDLLKWGIEDARQQRGEIAAKRRARTEAN